MTSQIVNQVAFLRTSRSFPDAEKDLKGELSKTYLDVANAVNDRTIGLYPTLGPATTGNSYFLNSNARQQSLRRVYSFTTTVDIEIGFKLTTISQFVQFFGIYTDVIVTTPPTSPTNWYGLIPATSVAIAGQISFYVTVNGASTTSDVIRIVVGAGAPALTYGTIVLEWLAFP